MGSSAQHLDKAALQAHFLLRLAQGGVGGHDIFRVARPPGKATCPECVDRWAVRSVSSTVGCSRCTMGTSTAAWAGGGS
jgi:hypothetical protein